MGWLYLTDPFASPIILSLCARFTSGIEKGLAVILQRTWELWWEKAFVTSFSHLRREMLRVWGIHILIRLS